MKHNMNIDVSIVIICMNKPENLRVCLGSIKNYTSVSYEVFVVAYLFSEDKLNAIRQEFPWVHFIESNEIRGFSENNNLALRMAKGKYCFILNDDTELRMPAIDKMVETFKKLPKNAAIVSPKLVRADGSVQCCGRPEYNWKTFLTNRSGKKSPFVDKEGVFKSYNVIGAAFLIKTEIFKSIGWFDENYFFTPEDIAVSTKLNKMGYECWVNSDAEIIHYEGMSGKSLSLIKTATAPAGRRGLIMFYSDNNILIWFLLNASKLFEDIICFLLDTIIVKFGKPSEWIKIRRIARRNLIRIAFSRKMPKDIFIHFYKLIKHQCI